MHDHVVKRSACKFAYKYRTSDSSSSSSALDMLNAVVELAIVGVATGGTELLMLMVEPYRFPNENGGHCREDSLRVAVRELLSTCGCYVSGRS